MFSVLYNYTTPQYMFFWSFNSLVDVMLNERNLIAVSASKALIVLSQEALKCGVCSLIRYAHRYERVFIWQLGHDIHLGGLSIIAFFIWVRYAGRNEHVTFLQALINVHTFYIVETQDIFLFLIVFGSKGLILNREGFYWLDTS